MKYGAKVSVKIIDIQTIKGQIKFKFKEILL